MHTYIRTFIHSKASVRGPREVNKTYIHIYMHTSIQCKPRNMVTGKDSPVRAASSTSISPSFTRQSAGTADPDASRTMSPRIVHSVVHSLLNAVVLTVALVVVRRACQGDE